MVDRAQQTLQRYRKRSELLKSVSRTAPSAGAGALTGIARPLLVVMAILIGWFTVFAPSASAEGAYTTAPTPAKGAEIVHVGIEPISFDSIDVSANDFATSFYVWWRWKGPIDPVSSTDIVNATQAKTHYVVTYSYTNAAGEPKPITLDDGFKYQTAKIATGIGANYSVARFPLDNQDLTIRVENNTYDFEQLAYEPDTANLSKTPGFDVPGWNIKTVTMVSLLHQYGTNFGVVGQGEAASQYSQLAYTVNIDRPIGHFVWKLLLPMIVVLMAVLGALFVMEDKTDVRLILVGTGLLTLILLQDGYSGELPLTAPAVVMDYIYIAGYAAVGATFTRVIYTANQIHHHENDRHLFIKTDRKAAITIALGFLIAVVVLLVA